VNGLLKKVFIIAGTLVLLTVALLVIYETSMNPALSRQDALINAVELPDTIEKIVVRSAIGDSGGNGDHRTLRSVMLVRTELTIDDLREFFANQAHTPDRIEEASGYLFTSRRTFRLEFEELRDVDEFGGYYFIEFIG